MSFLLRLWLLSYLFLVYRHNHIISFLRKIEFEENDLNYLWLSQNKQSLVGKTIKLNRSRKVMLIDKTAHALDGKT